MRILFTHSFVIYKGAWGRTFPIAASLVKLGNEVTIITMANKLSFFPRKKYIDGVKVVLFPSLMPKKKYYDPISIFLKIIYVLFHKYDIVHSDIGQRPQSGLPCRISKMLKGTKYVSEWMDFNGKGGQYDTKSWLFKLLLGRHELKYEYKDRQYADGVITLADPLYKKAIEIRNDKNVVKIHGGCLVDKIPHNINNSEYKKKLDLPEDILTFGYIDQSINQIEIQPLLDAIIQLDIFEKVKILVFGGDKSKKMRIPEVLQKCIIQFGWVDFTKEYEKLLAVDVFVFFKEDDFATTTGWPNAIGDYIACGRPVILTPLGETIDFVKKYSKGFFIVRDDGDVVKYVSDIYYNRQILIDKGVFNRNIAESYLSWEQKAIEVRNFYHKLLIN